MIFFIVLTFFVLLIIVFLITRNNQNNKKNILLSLKKYEEDLQNAILEFEFLGNDERYFSNRDYINWKHKYSFLFNNVVKYLVDLKTSGPLKRNALYFRNYYLYGRNNYINDSNDNFIKKESIFIKEILDKYGIPGNHDQIRAIASDEDNTLLVAGAGTGKTTTILGKLAYLIERKKIASKDILLLSFTGKAVEELSERIESIFKDINIKARTFHSFGRSVIAQAKNEKPEVATEAFSKNFIKKEFDKLLLDADYKKKAIKYFAYYFKPIITHESFNSFTDYEKYLKTEKNLTLKKETVKSRQEAMIANLLYLNGINYAYEGSYKHKVSDINHGQYKPDFYLTDYDIYLEHFGVNRDGLVKFSNNEERNLNLSKKYREGMEWKRKIHAEYKTELIETFSYEFFENKWEKDLLEKLKNKGVIFKMKVADDVLDDLKKTKEMKLMVELFNTFLKLSQANGYNIENIQYKIDARKNIREQIFFEIFSPIHSSYKKELKNQAKIDFDDMLIQSSKIINENSSQEKFKYIIIDEFQDFSVSKKNLIKSLCKQNPETKLFCVGDDWQSIFRFTGSDISLMVNFEENHGFTRRDKLETTNRFGQNIATISNEFILKNYNQINKKLNSFNDKQEGTIEIINKANINDTEIAINNILTPINDEATLKNKKYKVFILGRYKHNQPESLKEMEVIYKNLQIEFLTVHKSKGLEADYVIVKDVISGIYGFPTEITDDPILNIVLSKEENFLHAEERRLFYVAITRAKKGVYVLTKNGKESPFISELIEIKDKNMPVSKL